MTNTTQGIKVGDYFVSSWGYDQTNIDFYRVLGVTAQSVRVQKWTSRQVGSQGIDNLVVPGDVPHEGWVWEGNDSVRKPAKIKTKRVRAYGNRPVFSVNTYANAYLWARTPVAETDPRWGH
jgi:hypothetical protein